MAWTVRVTLDRGKPTVGNLTATWNEGLDDEYTVSHRVDMKGTDMAAIVKTVKDSHADRKTKDTDEATLAAKVASALNA